MNAKLLEHLINQINSNIAILREMKIEIKDSENFGFAVDYISYSSAQDEVLVTFKKSNKEDE